MWESVVYVLEKLNETLANMTVFMAFQGTEVFYQQDGHNMNPFHFK